MGEGGRDLGMVGEVTHVNHELLEVLLDKKYVPVVSPVGLGEDGEGYNINADAAAAEIADRAQGREAHLPDRRPGHPRERRARERDRRARAAREDRERAIGGGMVAKAKSVLRAIEGGVASVHILDGRTPHSVIAELFTDHGVGTLIVGD